MTVIKKVNPPTRLPPSTPDAHQAKGDTNQREESRASREAETICEQKMWPDGGNLFEHSDLRLALKVDTPSRVMMDGAADAGLPLQTATCPSAGSLAVHG